MSSRETPLPVLKWAGGKRQLVDKILVRLPKRIRTYHEPFVGGGAVFFALAAIPDRFERAVLADKNLDLINVYKTLQRDTEKLIRVLERHQQNHSEEYYYRVRDSVPRTNLERAARVIYLNKTGYNGLYRVNSKGEFNVPFGRYKNPKICDEHRLRASAIALQRADIVQADFEAVCARAERGDAVYLDPPYLPVSKTSNFSAYHRDAFGIPEHQRLARVFGELRDRGIEAVLSNSATDETREIFGNFEVRTVKATRSINSNAARRGAVSEILVSNKRA